MRILRASVLAMVVALMLAGPGSAADPSWPKELTFALLSTENAGEITRRWGPIIAQLEKPGDPRDARGGEEARRPEVTRCRAGPSGAVAGPALWPVRRADGGRHPAVIELASFGLNTYKLPPRSGGFVVGGRGAHRSWLIPTHSSPELRGTSRTPPHAVGGGVMRNVRGSIVGLLAAGLSMLAGAPASAQDPMAMALGGAMLPFFSDPAAGEVSVFEMTSPVVPTVIGLADAPVSGASPDTLGFTNPLHMVFFRENCARSVSTADVETAKQAKAVISSAPPMLLDFNGLMTVASTIQGNDLLPLNFPLHTRVHWIDAKTGRTRNLEPIILDTFLTLAEFVPLVENPGAGASIGLCGPGAGVFAGSVNNPFCWAPLRSAATFVTPQESASLRATIYLICPTADIQNSAGAGIFPITAGFPRIQNRDGSFGFPSRNVITGNSSTTLRGRIYDDDEDLVRDIQVGCACLTRRTVISIDTVYGLPPTNLGAHTVPVWYTELETQTANPNPVVPGSAQQFSFTGYWGLEVTGQAGTLFHRMSTASLDNLSFGTVNPFANR